jgi:hypothetical protein
MGFGPPSPPVTKATKYSPGAPPKNLIARLDKSANKITIMWDASCPSIDEEIGYVIAITDLHIGKTSFTQITKSKDASFR